MLFADMAVDEGAEVPPAGCCSREPRPRSRSCSARPARTDTTVAEVLRAIDFAVAAIEIVDSRIADWKIGILDTVADNASSGLYVLGSSPVASRCLRPDQRAGW
jgi:2-keto-4-pentenoate hydratase